MKQVVLASASPRRQALLQQIGIACQQQAMDVDERQLSGEDPVAYVQRLARMKAEACWQRDAGMQSAVIVAADTVVVVDGRVLGKPVDRADGLRMLASLSGRRHTVSTGVAVLSAQGMSLACVSTRVTMAAINEREAEAYWATGEPADKAGAYGIQGLGAVFVQGIEGSYSAVVGLPLMETAALLAQHGVPLWQESAGGH